ncbi:hypothetical protein [Nitrospira lenta]|uniref:Secreted protein n=1 Tax=Nitrospira lenta TaxID=1436998 RepID=A0A330L1G3_9BACT|nr:hypothetical protein [Nitrospira lenta]SPP63099.1 conserved exported hypothetical protein [Nitrospira lenta]
MNLRLRIAVVVFTLLAVSVGASAAEDFPVVDSPALQSLNEQFSRGGVGSEGPFDAPASLSQYSPSSSIFRDIPSISGHYSVGGRTIMPYLGAGFGGGYTSDLNRSLIGPPPVQSDVGLRSQFGQGLSPNEFQLGLRIPF